MILEDRLDAPEARLSQHPSLGPHGKRYIDVIRRATVQLPAFSESQVPIKQRMFLLRDYDVVMIDETPPGS